MSDTILEPSAAPKLSGQPPQPQQEEVEQATHEQRQLGALKDRGDWGLMVDKIRDYCADLITLKGVDVSLLSATEIGERFIAASLAASYLEDFVAEVEATHDQRP